MPQHFKNHGYFTQGIGKLFHNWRQEIEGDPKSWSVPQLMHFARHGDDKPVSPDPGQLPPNLSRNPKCDRRAVPDSAYFDGRIADLAIDVLEQLKKKHQPFFLGVGFWKPHLPFNAPKILGPYDPVPPPLAIHNNPQRADMLSRCPRNASIFRRQTTNIRPTPRTTPRLLCHHQLWMPK